VNYTDNYNLRKPELTDPVDIDDLNYNADEIDSLLKGLADGLDGITPEGIGAETPTGAQQKANQAETNAKSYADIVANGVLNSAKDYADIVTNNALNSAKDYADGVLESANSHTDQVASDLSQKLNETRIKVLDVEQDVSNINKVLINLNSNHEAKQTASGYGIVTLPKNAANGQVSVGLKGQTATNMVKNGNFKKGLENWTSFGSTNAIEDGVLVNTSTANRYPSSYQNTKIDCIEGKKIFARAIVQTVNTARVISLNLIGADATTGLQAFKSIAYPSENTQYSLSGIVTINSGQEGKVKISVNHSYYDMVAGRKIKVLNVMAIELVGEDLNLTTEQLNVKYPNYFTGTKSTISAMRIKSVGKNLVTLNPADWEQGGVVATTGASYSASNRIRTVFIPVQPSTNYVISIYGEGWTNRTRLHFYDNEKNWIEASGFIGSKSYCSPSNAAFVRFSIGKEDDSEITPNDAIDAKVKLEKGDQATDYEPYTESTQYITAKDEEGKIAELRSLPNGTKDEVDVTGGKVTQRIGVKTSVPSGTVINYADMATGGQFVAYDADGQVVQTGIKGDTLTADATQLNYQLATPIEIPIQTSGSLVSYPSGTVYIEPYVADAGIYADKMEVLYSDLPIKALEKISKVDFATGLEIELDITAALIAEDKLSFTHPNLTSGDIVFFTYEYDRESTEGETEIEYYDSRYVIIDSVTGKIYKWQITVANGVPSIELTEV
jgi:hypothetical protein